VNFFPEAVTTLLFDLDGTLITRSPSASQVFFELIQQICPPGGPEAERQTRRFVHYYWARSAEAARDIEEFGKFTPEFWENYLIRQSLAYGCSPQEARKAAGKLAPLWDEAYQPDTVVAPDVHPTLEHLRRAGYTLGLVSNRSLPFDEEIGQLGLDRHFHFTLIAGEIESWKPERKIFEHALELAGSAPSAAVYVGDNYYADILGAAQSGLTPVLIDPDGLFPEADCRVIERLGDLLS
jgi:putative hydrolase of the HAD superfamily